MNIARTDRERLPQLFARGRAHGAQGTALRRACGQASARSCLHTPIAPLRVLDIRTDDARARLLSHMDDGNVEKEKQRIHERVLVIPVSETDDEPINRVAGCERETAKTAVRRHNGEPLVTPATLRTGAKPKGPVPPKPRLQTPMSSARFRQLSRTRGRFRVVIPMGRRRGDLPVASSWTRSNGGNRCFYIARFTVGSHRPRVLLFLCRGSKSQSAHSVPPQ